LVHSCGKEKPNQRDPPTSEITSEQLLTLITELSIQENKGEKQDFWEKLQIVYAKNSNYLEAVNRALSLQKEYQQKIAKLSEPRQKN
jgi:hypothetical protein